MIKVRVALRSPGGHRQIAVVEMPGIPREGEWLVVDKDHAAYTVHSVTWSTEPDDDGCLVAILVK